MIDLFSDMRYTCTPTYEAWLDRTPISDKKPPSAELFHHHAYPRGQWKKASGDKQETR